MDRIRIEWLRERTTLEEILADWNQRRREHHWWTPPTAEWLREWESFVNGTREGDEIFHFSQNLALFPVKGYGDEGYVAIRDGKQIQTIFWVRETAVGS